MPGCLPAPCDADAPSMPPAFFCRLWAQLSRPKLEEPLQKGLADVAQTVKAIQGDSLVEGVSRASTHLPGGPLPPGTISRQTTSVRLQAA